MSAQEYKFAEFCAAIGKQYRPHMIRQALWALQLQPYAKAGDMRVLWYPVAWVSQVRDFLDARGESEKGSKK